MEEELIKVELDLNDVEGSIISLTELALNLAGQAEDKDLGHLTSKALKALVRPFVEFLVETKEARGGLPVMAICKAYILLLSMAVHGCSRAGREVECATACAEGMKADLLELVGYSALGTTTRH